jgi:hypothetical protein
MLIKAYSINFKSGYMVLGFGFAPVSFELVNAGKVRRRPARVNTGD